MKKEFEVSFVKNNVPQGRIVRAENADMAERFFRWKEPSAVFCGVSEHHGRIKPGMPVNEVPNDWEEAAR